MKKIYKSLVFTMATIALTSCVNDWLDLTPSDSIPSNSAITNYNDAKTALYGMYDGLQGNLLQYILCIGMLSAIYDNQGDSHGQPRDWLI